MFIVFPATVQLMQEEKPKEYTIKQKRLVFIKAFTSSVKSFTLKRYKPMNIVQALFVDNYKSSFLAGCPMVRH